MADTGATLPGTAATESVSPEDDNDWSNPNNIKVDDANYASSIFLVPNKYSYRLKASNFGFSVPEATVNGILVGIKKVGSSNLKDYRVQLLDADGSLVGDNKADTVTGWPASATEVQYGGSEDTWSATPTADMVNNANFGVAISGKSSGTVTGLVYFVKITVYYTTGAARRHGVVSFQDPAIV